MKTKHGQTAILLAVALAANAAAAEYPARPIRFIVPYGGGSGPDITARLFATELSKQIGQQIVVDNRPGASGSIGTEMIARAAPDGYTIGFGDSLMHSSKAKSPSGQRSSGAPAQN